jgi:hypothetical protein
MGIAPNEARRRRKADAPNPSGKKHPIAAIEKRVIDSEAFAALSPSAVVVLLLLARNLDKGMNGHVFVSANDAEKHGIDRKTLYRQLKALVSAGFIFPTTKGGHGKCGRFALTWLPMSKDRKGLHVEDFQPCKYLDHETNLIEWKKRMGKMSPRMGQISLQATKLEDKNTPSHGDIFPYVEVNTNTQLKRCSTTATRDWMPAYLSSLVERGFTGRPCFFRSLSEVQQ